MAKNGGNGSEEKLLVRYESALKINNILCQPSHFLIAIDECVDNHKNYVVFAAHYTEDKKRLRIGEWNKKDERKEAKNNEERMIYLRSLDTFRYCEFQDDKTESGCLFSRWRVIGGLIKDILITNIKRYEDFHVIIDGEPKQHKVDYIKGTDYIERRIAEVANETLIPFMRDKGLEDMIIDNKEFAKRIIFFPDGDNRLNLLLKADLAASYLNRLKNAELNEEDKIYLGSKLSKLKKVKFVDDDVG